MNMTPLSPTFFPEQSEGVRTNLIPQTHLHHGKEKVKKVSGTCQKIEFWPLFNRVHY